MLGMAATAPQACTARWLALANDLLMNPTLCALIGSTSLPGPRETPRVDAPSAQASAAPRAVPPKSGLSPRDRDPVLDASRLPPLGRSGSRSQERTLEAAARAGRR